MTKIFPAQNFDTARKPNIQKYLVLVLIFLSGIALYIPFLSNGLIFDDQSFFYGSGVFSTYALTPFNFYPRTLPYFSFAFIQATSQSFEIQRLANIFLHCTNAWLIFLLLQSLQQVPASSIQQKLSDEYRNISITSGGVALAFVLHPVAVYGAGYLTQRTILFATFFSLLALLKFKRAIDTNSWPALFWAVTFSIGAMFSKEHAVTLPASVACLLLISRTQPTIKQIKTTAIYLVLCAPFMAWLVYLLRNMVAAPYEIHAPLYLQDQREMLWLRSALTECGLYFSYLRIWLLPDTSLMSIDLRVPFPESWLSTQAVLGGSAFLLSLVLGTYLTLRSTRFRLFGFGLLYTQSLFLVELSSIRVQEPLVLYRSYLWAPGFLFMALDLIKQLSMRQKLAVFLLILPILGYQSVDRLKSMSTSLSVWNDAQAKLSSDLLPGAFRIYFNRGVRYSGQKKNDAALSDFATCERLNPEFSGCFSGKAGVLFRQNAYQPALTAISTALSLDPRNAGDWETKGKILEALGQNEASAEAYETADTLGGSIATIMRKGYRQLEAEK